MSLLQSSLISDPAATRKPMPPTGLDNGHRVFRIGTYVYWAISYVNDRISLATILPYDQDYKLGRKWSKSGARYIWKDNVENQKVLFGKKDAQAREFTIDELLVIPIVTTADSTQPTPPADLKYTTLDEGLSRMYLAMDPLFGCRYWYWALSFNDNRAALAILAYDRKNKLLGYVTENRTRYIACITVQENQVKFIGQSDSSVAYTIKELDDLLIMPDPLAPLITIANLYDQPPPPHDLQYIYLSASGDRSGSYPVLRYSGLTYWALSYVSQRVSLCILGYDADKKLVKRFSKDGARYLSRIVLEGSEKVKFIGKEGSGKEGSVTFTLQELVEL